MRQSKHSEITRQNAVIEKVFNVNFLHFDFAEIQLNFCVKGFKIRLKRSIEFLLRCFIYLVDLRQAAKVYVLLDF